MSESSTVLYRARLPEELRFKVKMYSQRIRKQMLLQEITEKAAKYYIAGVKEGNFPAVDPELDVLAEDDEELDVWGLRFNKASYKELRKIKIDEETNMIQVVSSMWTYWLKKVEEEKHAK